MIPTSLILALLMLTFGLAVGKFYVYYIRGMAGPFGVWLIALLSLLLGLVYPVVAGFGANTGGVDTLFLTLALVLLAGMAGMLAIKTPARKVRKGLVVAPDVMRRDMMLKRQKAEANRVRREQRLAREAAQQQAAGAQAAEQPVIPGPGAG